MNTREQWNLGWSYFRDTNDTIEDTKRFRYNMFSFWVIYLFNQCTKPLPDRVRDIFNQHVLIFQADSRTNTIH